MTTTTAMSSSPFLRSTPSQGFPPTRWTLVNRSADKDQSRAFVALDELCTLYWQPLYIFLRRSGLSEHDAEDATQEFLTHALDRQLFNRADAQRGRLRSFLLKSLKNFVSDRRKIANASKRGGGTAVISIDYLEAERGFTAESNQSPEQEFELRWARQLLENALQKVRENYIASNREALFEGLSPLLSWNVRSRPQKEIAEELGLTDSAMRVSLHRMRSKFATAVRELVADTVSDPSEVEDEIRELFKVLSGK